MNIEEMIPKTLNYLLSDLYKNRQKELYLNSLAYHKHSTVYEELTNLSDISFFGEIYPSTFTNSYYDQKVDYELVFSEEFKAYIEARLLL